ncbi:MAG: DUF916 domain-containing protein [Candidatus Levybacteria bacterium]|nr:DUF916 domain-containing protein [Candidatus Levybacteria bacterium]
MNKKLIVPLNTAAAILLSTPVHAESATLGIYPPIIKITAQPGSAISIPITVVNASQNEKLVDISVLGFKSSNNTQGIVEYYGEENIPHALSSLINTVKFYDEDNQIKSIKLYAGEQKNLQVKFKAPGKTEADYYFSPVFTVNSTSESQKEQTTVKVSQSIASHILLSVNPTQNPTAYISDLSSNPIILNGPVKISLEVTNDSPNYISTDGSIAIYNVLGKKVSEAKIAESIILSNSTKKIGTNDKQNTIEITGTFIGLYSVKSELSLNNTKTVSKETFFLYIPFTLLLVVCVLLVVMLGVGYRVIKKLNFRQS